MSFEPLSEASLGALSLLEVVLDEDESLRLSLALSCVLPCPMLWLHVRLHDACSRSKVVLGALPLIFRMGFEPLSEAPLSALQPPAHSFLVVLAEVTCLREFLDLSFVLPDRRYASMATCTAPPPVRKLSFVLGNISLWGGFGLCLKILFVPCGCRRAYCGPHCSRESARVLASLFGSSPSGVRHLSRVCSSV